MITFTNLILFYIVSVIYAHICLGIMRVVDKSFLNKGNVDSMVGVLWIPFWNVFMPTFVVGLALAEIAWSRLPKKIYTFYTWLYKLED